MNCSTCPKGFKCPTKGLMAPQPCALGTYQNNEGQSTCIDCPAGMYCNDTRTVSVSCPSGMYSESGSSICIECPAGYRWVLTRTVFITLCTAHIFMSHSR